MLKTSKNGLDKNLERRGRKPQIQPSTVVGRADNYRTILWKIWDDLSPLLLRANTKAEVEAAFQTAIPSESNFTPLADLILGIIKDPYFPNTPKGQISFLADSLGGSGMVTFRRSRDICVQERKKAKLAHHIIRFEYYIECSCGYKGPSRDHACKKCGARILPSAALASYIA